MKLKQFTSILLTMILVITLLGVAALTVGAESASTPVRESENVIFANGTPLYIVAGTNGGTAIYYMNGSNKVYLNASGAAGDNLSNMNVWGGIYNANLDGDVSITMTGGKIKNITGSGSVTGLGGVNNVTITISGGTVTGGVYPANHGRVNGNATITMTGGTVNRIGICSKSTVVGNGSTAVAGNSILTITGGKVTERVDAGDGNYPVYGTRTIISTVPITMNSSTTMGTTEAYLTNYLYREGDTWKVKGNVTLPAGATITVGADESLSVPAGATLTNKGTIVNNGTLDIKGTFNQNGSVTCTSHVYTYECDKTCDFCGATRSASCSSNTASITTTESGLVVRCQHCGERIGSISLMVSDSKYNGQNNAVGIFAGGLSPYDRVYLDATGQELNEIPILPGTYTVRVTYNGASVSKDFTISKGVLKVTAAPSVSYLYGEDPTTKTLTGGTVVIEGNESTTVTGTWAWSGTKAVFTPDAEYDGLFETLGEQEATHNVQLTPPLVTITLPSPSAMPGMKVDLGIKVRNPYTDTPEVLPTEFTYKYKIGGGALQTATGDTFTIPADAPIGSTVSVYVESVAVEGKYFSGRSGTVEIYLGQVDYSEDIEKLGEDLEAAREELQRQLDALDGTYATDSDVADKVAGIQDQIDALDNTYATDADVADKIAGVQDQIDALDNTYATDVALANAVANIQNQIDELVRTLATKEALELARADLQNQINSLDDTYATDADVSNKIAGIQDQIDALDSTYATDVALDEAVADIQAQIDELVRTLATKDELSEAEKKLSEALAANYKDLLGKINSLDAAVGGIRYALEKADADNKAELIAMLETAEAELAQAIAAVQSNLDEAKKALEESLADTNASLSEKITALTEALNEAKAALEAADAADKKALEDKMDEGYDALADALEALEDALRETEIVLSAEDTVMKKNAAELAEKVDGLETFLIIVCVIAGVALIGCVSLTAWIVVSKKKSL